MHIWLTPDQAAKHLQKHGHSTTADTIREWCRTGQIKHCDRVGERWHIDCTATWPEYFPDTEAPKATDFMRLPAAEAASMGSATISLTIPVEKLVAMLQGETVTLAVN